MEIESRVELPDGHLVNLSPRPHNHGQYQAYRADYATELSANSPSRYHFYDNRAESASPRGSEDTMFHKAKATKLPVPKTFADKGRDQRNQTPSPTAIPKPSPTNFSSGGSGGPPNQSGDRNREHTWRRLKDRFEKDSSPLSQRSSYVRSRNSDQSGSPDPSNAKKSNKDKPASRAGRSAIPSPPANRSIAHGSRQRLSVNAESKKQWTDHDSDNAHQKPGRFDTTNSGPDSQSSISPVSAGESVADWEDRFVVHMPSAKDPNPPTMTTQQISEYQKSIERKKRERRRGRVSDISVAPSSRNVSAERDNSSQPPQKPQPEQRTETFKTYNGRPSQSQPEADRQQATPSQPQNSLSPAQLLNNYYSPEEIGKNRISTIWEESSPSKPRDKRPGNDGSFLGCKEINGPGTKNPDEILLFSSAQEAENLQPRPLAKQQKADAGNNAIQEEWTEISQNSKHAQCWKLSSKSLCQDPNCSDHEIERADSQGSSKENTHPRPSFESAKEHPEDIRGEDDVFIITPTVTRTMLPSSVSEKKALNLKTQGLRRPGGTGQLGTGEAVKAVRAKAQVVSTPSGLRPAGGASQTKSIAPSTPSSKTPASLSNAQSRTTPSKRTPSKETPSKDARSKETPTKETQLEDTPSKENPPKAKNDQEKTGNQPASTIRGFIRTSGLGRSGGIVRSPTDSLATILRNGTESLRNRAESFRNANGSLYFSSRKGSPVSLNSAPSRDNSESSRSERSFRSALSSVKDTPPCSAKPSPVKKSSPAAKRVSIDKGPPQEITPPRESRLPRQNSPPRQKTPTPQRAKVSSRETSPSADDPRLAAERQARAERLEKFKEEARLRRATRMAGGANPDNLADKSIDEKEIAELDGHQVTGSKPKRYLHPNITDVCDDLREGLHPGDKNDSIKEGANALALSMVFEIIVMAITQMHKAVHNGTDSQYAKVLINNVLNMARHCYRVFTRVYRVISDYQATGKWPRAKNDKAISGFLMELLQAVLYLFVLGFGALVVGRAASYVLLVGSWMLWFAKPFAWAVQGIGRALVM
ncbi:hypothetical protein N7481_011328 [Penicillium waksmanii]|uniref:uncharacterized protein n=1 Tax=Penicillium waksmanii TaxID=69791 RepID=UPI00254688A0|nr:uncharacterized protein N7481_011328 [Penicillium waksmanii]KAJ5974118.1 hypothetical protein N7481_011328 [Penicillium waksmanii]